MYPNGANLDASANFKEYISNIWPKQANKPISISQDHCVKVGFTQTTGTKHDPMMVPTTPVNNKVSKGLSVE